MELWDDIFCLMKSVFEMNIAISQEMWKAPLYGMPFLALEETYAGNWHRIISLFVLIIKSIQKQLELSQNFKTVSMPIGWNIFCAKYQCLVLIWGKQNHISSFLHQKGHVFLQHSIWDNYYYFILHGDFKCIFCFQIVKYTFLSL